MIERYTFMQERETHSLGITARNLSLSIGTKKLIDSSNFTFNSGDRVALIGRNGAGKSTLFETIYAIYQRLPLPNGVSVEGSLEISPKTRIGYLPQAVQIHFDGTVEDYLDSCAQETAQIVKDFEELTKLVANDQSEGLLSKLGESINLMDVFNGWSYLDRKKKIIEGLGFQNNYLARKIREISGGEATKIALAGVLIANPDIILLDEPTNNLDTASILFLEKWINGQSSLGFVIVAHDRVFLDNTVRAVFEIDEESEKIISFGGNYSFYFSEKQKIFAARLREYEIALKKRRQLEKEVQRLKANAQSFETISPESFFRRKGAKLQKKALRLRTRAEKMLEETPEPKPPKIPNIEIGEVLPGKSRIFSISSLSFSYPDSERDLFGGVSFSLHQDERIAIIGPNGSGKSTLLKIVIGEIKPENAVLEFNRNMRIGYIPQTLLLTNPQENLLDFCGHHIAGAKDEVNALLGKVLFTDASQLRVGNLSLGELKRALFAIIFAQGPDLLVLDEPINHLDIQTAEILDGALERYNGAVLAVSHDRYFLQKLKPQRILIISNGRVVEKPIQNEDDIIDAFEAI